MITEKEIKDVEAEQLRAIQDLDRLIQRVKNAQKEFSTFSQEKVDEIFKKAAMAANNARISLAKEAVAETRMGIVEDKVIKNHFAAEYIYNKYKNEKTCGVICEDASQGMTKIAEPIGVIAGVVPTTNPTSTAIFKALLALKTRNAIIFSPHPRAKNCTINAARIVLEAAVKAGAPADIIGWIETPSVALSQYLMQHSDVNLILATGGPGMVKAAYSSGKPALGVGAGNTPVIIDETADIKMAVNSVILSKTFDNGVICASEQSIITMNENYEAVKEEFTVRGAHFVYGKDREKLAKTVIIDGHVNPNIVGQSAEKIAEMAGINVPAGTKILVAEAENVGEEEAFSYEKLSPVLGFYRVGSYEEAVEKAVSLVEFGGAGHTSVLYTSPARRDRVQLFQSKMITGRTLINMPAAQGAIGDVYNFSLAPSLTLGCGSWGGNSASENIGVKHLLNVKSVAERRENMLWFRVPPKIYFKQGALKLALEELAGKKRAFIVTDKILFDLGYTKKVTDILESVGVTAQIFSEVKPDPDLSTINYALNSINAFQPDVIIALGGGSPIDAAKIMWLMYEHPEVQFEDLAMRFADIRKRIVQFPELGNKATMVAIPTTSGTGSEVTPFAVITDDSTNIKYPIADYALTPNMAIVDPDLVMSMPRGLAAVSGFDALTHALEAYSSILATSYTNGLALEAIQLVFDNLPASYREGANNPEARENIHYASTIAGMAFANAFLGVCHSMAHKLGSAFHLPHGLANALMISQVIKFNIAEAPTKQAAFSQYKYPSAKARYAKIADFLGLTSDCGKDDDKKVNKLLEAIETLKKDLDIPLSIKDAGVTEEDFFANIDELCELAFDDQCTGANPRYPLMSEIKAMYTDAFYGRV